MHVSLPAPRIHCIWGCCCCCLLDCAMCLASGKALIVTTNQPTANRHRCAHHNNHHEGFMNFMHRDEEVNYFPSRWVSVGWGWLGWLMRVVVGSVGLGWLGWFGCWF